MPGLHNQVWVTSVLCDRDVEKALILCMSLRRTFTTRKIAVIASNNLEPRFRQALNRAFDFVFYLDENLNTVGLKMEDFAKAYLLSVLRGFEKCVYVSPSMMALKNCDELFSEPSDGLAMLDNRMDTSILLIRPSLEDFERLMTLLGKCNLEELDLNNWISNNYKTTCMIPRGFAKVISINSPLLGSEAEMSMVNFLDYPNPAKSSNQGNTGILEQLVETHWLKIYKEDVLPLLDSSNLLQPTGIATNTPFGHVNEPIAIVGMSCRYPGSNNLEEFWNLLVQGEDAISTPPPFRWLREQCSTHEPGAMKMNAGFLKDPVDEFDAKFFGISPKEVLSMDPQHRLLHELVWEALEDACINPHTLRGTSGSVFMGSWRHEYEEIVAKAGNIDFFREYMGNSIGAGAARISFLLGMMGPSIATESGCSSAIVAVDLACTALRKGQTGLALACGVNMILKPFDKDTLPLVFSPDGHSKTFSEDANGFARAEGGGVLVLKRLSEAFADGDRIWGLIRGSAVSQEGISKSMGTPTVHCESLAMKGALNDANVLPELVSYVEAHGTGTIVGDPMEVAAIGNAYHSPTRNELLIIGSVKTNVGHTESCSGITGIMKVILAMHHELIPAHRNFTKLNPSIDLDAVPAVIPLQPTKWPRINGKPRFAGVSSFGITGTDAHVILEEPPQTPNQKLLNFSKIMKRRTHILNISAKSEEAMEILLQKYKDFLNASGDSVADIAYSANTGRANFAIRTSLIGKSKEEMIDQITKKTYLTEEADGEKVGKICFLFTGQGSQYPEMGKQLYETSPIFRMHFDYCDKLLKEMYSISIKNVIWSSKPNEESKRTIYSQTSIFCVEYALLKLWESWRVKLDYVLGHSLGEFSAAVCAGILTVEDALKLVAERSKLIDELPRGKMLVIKAGEQQVVKMLKEFAGGDHEKMLDIAAVNSAQQTVVAGDSDLILEFSEICHKGGIKSVLLEATHAFHSKHMDPMLEKYRNVAKTIDWKNSNEKCGYISGMKGEFIENDSLTDEYWVQHTRDKVRFLCASQRAVELGCRVFIEVGPQPVLSALTMMNNEGRDLMCLPSLKRNENEWTTLLATLSKLYVKGVDIDWSEFDQFFTRNKVRLPHYPFIGKKFWPELLLTDSGDTIHPFLGSIIPNASHVKLFQNGFNLKNHEYIKDHAIGQTVVFPGAGYLEMCLAAGLASMGNSADSLGSPNHPMKVENLVIKAPLALQEDKTCQMQTVVEMNKASWENVKVEIFQRVNSGFEEKWVSHASATFSPVVSEEENMLPLESEQFHATLSKPSDSNLSSQLYDKLATVGLNFGNAFKSLETVWKCDTGSFLAKVRCPIESGTQFTSYIIHPVILDAMIQAIMLPKLGDKLKKTLYIPIKVGKLVWMSNGVNDFKDRFVYVNNTENGSTAAKLLDLNGTILASMSNVDFAETTLKTVEAVLEQQSFTMPDMWEEVWRPQVGPQQYRLDMKNCKDKFYNEEFYQEIVEKYNKMSPNFQNIFHQLEKLSYGYMLRSLYQCGFQPVVGAVYDETDMLIELKIQDQFSKYFSYMLTVLEEENVFGNVGSKSWKLLRIPPSLQQLEVDLSSISGNLINAFKPTTLFIKFGENLCSILQGSQSALSILFPEQEAKEDTSSMAEFYEDYAKFNGMSGMVTAVTEESISHLIDTHSQNDKPLLRICEIGAGTGSFSENILKVLTSLNAEFEYTYTDISSAFFPDAEKKFEKNLDKMIFRKMNIEEDPIGQGFAPEYYDIIYASDVIHATKNLKETLMNVSTILRPGGRFDMFEMTKVNRFITYLFGGLDGFWKFEDFDLRPNHCTLNSKGWNKILEESGFHVVEQFPIADQYCSLICSRRNIKGLNVSNSLLSKSESKAWSIFHQEDSPISRFMIDKISQLPNRRVIQIKDGSVYKLTEKQDIIEFQVKKSSEEDFAQVMTYIENHNDISLEGVVYCWSLEGKCGNQDEILKPFFYLSKLILQMKKSAGLKLVVLTRGVAPIEENNLTKFQNSTISGFLKSLQNERMDIHCRCVDIGENEGESGMMQTFQELWRSTTETQVAYQGTTRYAPKIVEMKRTLPDLKLPVGSDRFQLLLPETKAISDLQFCPLEPLELLPGEIEVQVKTSALNFRDVFSVLKPSEKFKDSNAVGFDFAGTVKRVHPNISRWNVGDNVFGMNVNGAALPSHVKMHELDVQPIPNDMTFSEACTLPAVFATSYHCLIDVAKIKPSDVVLIHTASGGVGLSAIEICKHIGATVIATAGSKRKQNYLKSLGIQHIFYSRNTEYSQNILKVTNGRGVNVVLNSLTSEGFKEETLKACAPGARFVEMSKLSIWSAQEVQLLRPDVQYAIVDISSMEANGLRRLMQKLKHFMDNKVVNPIPHVGFNGVSIREALQYLQKAKHIGKVVCKMPEVRNINGKMQVYTLMFHSNATYLITGGLGGIGFEVCKWMVKMGAKYVVLAGRSVASRSAKDRIHQLNVENAAMITAIQLDVSSFDQCRKLIQEKIPEMGFPALRGVMHAAGILHDGLIDNQSWDTFSSTFKTKIDGTLNLHELTKDNSKLEHFVLFSSMASLFGSPGQSNHSAGNQFEDIFAHYRNSIGLPATSVNWGQWGEVGIATEAEFPGMKPLTNLQGINGLEYVLKTQRVQTGVLNIESFVLLSKMFPHCVSSYFDDRVWKAATTLNSDGQNINQRKDEFWQLYNEKQSFVEKQEFLKEKLRQILRNILKIEEADGVKDNSNFQEIGVDSLMFVELKNAIQTLLGNRVTINASDLRDCNTAQVLSQVLINIIEGINTDTIKAPTMEQVAQLISEDCILPDNITPSADQQRIKTEEISAVLLTGVTGTLGPYILKELSSRKQVKQIICLIRPKRNISEDERLWDVLKERVLLQEIDKNKIRCVTGDVALSQLGMENEVWNELVDKVDAVFHFAALVQHVELYRKQNSEYSMRNVNVGGLKHVLEFCVTGRKLKHAFNASSVLGGLSVDENGNWSENWPEPNDFDGVTSLGYPVSKFVGDLLMKEAVTKRNIPGKSFRFPFIAGDSKTGRFVLEENHFMLRFIFYLKTGVMASNLFPLPVFPADVCANVSVDICLNPDAQDDIYNIINSKPDTEEEFVTFARRLGRDIKLVDFKEFTVRVLEENSGPLEVFKEFYTNEDYMMSLTSNAPMIKQWLLDGSTKEDFFESKKIPKIIPGFYETPQGRATSMEFVYKDLLFAKEQGWLAKFGL